MKKFTTAILAGVAMSLALAASAQAEGKTVGVSWSNFQEERWKTDEAAIKAALEAAGNKYISADAQSSAAKQLTDVEALIAHDAVRRINFTGSTRVGRIIAEISGRYLKPALLELGGKAPLVVLEDADLDEAVELFDRLARDEGAAVGQTSAMPSHVSGAGL